MTITEHGYTTTEARDLSKLGLEQCIDKMEATFSQPQPAQTQKETAMQKIVTSIWFEKDAEEAANYYVSLFKNSRITSIIRSLSDNPAPKGSVVAIDFELDGQALNIINGGPEFKFSEATSLLVNCEDQKEVDRLWDKMIADGGQPGPCGWLKDKYGFSWQIVPVLLNRLIQDPDKVKADRAMQAMLKMGKLDSAALQRAFDGK
jgi:predicted 3-demethylubiquinone-9 3-methyltransferase (glyoxalase superfamily)